MAIALLPGDNNAAPETRRWSQELQLLIQNGNPRNVAGARGGGSYPVSTRKKMCALLVTYRQSATQQLENRAPIPASFKEM
jgi:hypothetical protein